jgi:hypothetical protein
MLASQGVDLRREDDSSVTHISSLEFFKKARRRTFSNSKRSTSVAPTTIVVFTFI